MFDEEIDLTLLVQPSRLRPKAQLIRECADLLDLQIVLKQYLTKRQSQVLFRYFILDETQQEIANRFGVSKAAISQSKLKGLASLREQFQTPEKLRSLIEFSIRHPLRRRRSSIPKNNGDKR